MAQEGLLWWGDCVTEKKVHCIVCNAFKADIKTHCSTQAAAAFIYPLLVYSILLSPSLSRTCATCPLMILLSCNTASANMTVAKILLPPSKSAV